jgi:hypothetical protein
MSLEINLDYVSGYAKDSQNYCGLWGGSRRYAKGLEYANKLRKQWGLGYGEDGLKELPYSLMRNPSSDYFVHCEDIEDIFHQASEQYDDAKERRDACGWSNKRCKCRGDIDKAKWSIIRDWADGARNSQKANSWNRCDEEEMVQAGQNVIDQAQQLLDQREMGMSNEMILAAIGLGSVAIIAVLLKTVK